MNKKVTVYLLVCLVIIITIFILLISLKIDYYKQLPFEIKEDSVYVVLDNKPESIFINVNNKVYEVTKFTYLSNKTYILDFNIHKDINDKVFCYMTTYKLNYLAYIFKIVFNI